MNLRIATPHPLVSLTIPLLKLGKQQHPMIQILLKNDEISSSSISSEDNNLLDGCRYAFIIYKSKTNSKSKVKEHKLISNSLDNALHVTYLLKYLRKPTNRKDEKIKSHEKLKYVHLSPIVFVKLVIPADNKDRQSKTRLVKALVDSGASDSIFTKTKAEKLTVKKTKQ